MQINDYYVAINQAIQEYHREWFLPPTGLEVNDLDWKDFKAAVLAGELDPDPTLAGLPVTPDPKLERGSFRILRDAVKRGEDRVHQVQPAQ